MLTFLADKYIYPPKEIPKCVCLCGRLVGLDEGATRPVPRATNHPPTPFAARATNCSPPILA